MTRLRLLLPLVAALLVVAPAAAITGGSLDGGAHPAVGLLLADRGNGLEPDCSGSLVSPTVFVTAAHCIAGLPTNRFDVSFDPHYVAGTSALVAGTGYADPLYNTVKSDSHDLAVVVLDTAVLGVTPYALPTAGWLDSASLKSTTFTNVGYGYDDRTFTFDGYRRVSTSSFTNLKPTTIMLADRPGGVCFGDSGGPRLVGSTVVAVTSNGNANCTGQSTSYRLDTQSARTFLARFVTLP
jgi:V8-like Glu-specific endopeptidase